MDLHLNDKTALVTGSTAGIGLEIALKPRRFFCARFRKEGCCSIYWLR
jgi:hypothetical protein